MAPPERSEDGEPVFSGHLDVEEDKIDRVRLHALERRLSVLGEGQLELFILQDHLDGVAYGFVVVHDQYGSHGASRCTCNESGCALRFGPFPGAASSSDAEGRAAGSAISRMAKRWPRRLACRSR